MIFSKAMFVPQAHPEAEEVGGRSVGSRKAPVKEKMIVAFLYFLMVSSGTSLVLFLALTVQGHDGADKVLQVFTYTFSPLIGYFIGANKER